MPAIADRNTTAARLLRSSALHSYDPEVDIDWSAPLAEDKFFIPEPTITLYGTPLYERLSLRQRVELSKQEMVNTLSLGIWFEIILMQLLMRLAAQRDPRSGHVQYAFTEVADECRHSSMFGKVIETVGAKPYRQPLVLRRLGDVLPLVLRGPSMWIATLMGEEVFDALQREFLTDDTIQPLMRSVMRIHVTEEARHVKYAREDLARTLQRSTVVDREFARYVAAQAAMLLAKTFTRPSMYARAGLDPSAAAAAAAANPAHREMKRHGARKVVGFLTEQDMIGGPSKVLWQRSGLI